MALELGYWQIRGLAAPCRMMLSYAGLEFTEVTYTGATAGDWFGTHKPQLLEKNPLMTLPYLKDGDKIVTQSNSVLLYIARKAGLAGSGADDQSKIEMLLGDCYDLRDSLVNSVYWYKNIVRNVDEWNALKPAYFDKVAPYFNKYEAWLKLNGTSFFVGESPTAPDFHIWEMLDQHEALAADFGKESPLASRPLLKAFYDKFRALPQLEGYFAGATYKLPANVPGMAFWTGAGSAIPDEAPKN